ncbi:MULTISPECIES: hypothetical protein [unclassified Luteococcus]|uniref:hypothetical protein n=1 Tax=unclassified Luteococcus TaxID=2639923 RepID=UPI00313BF7B2
MKQRVMVLALASLLAVGCAPNGKSPLPGLSGQSTPAPKPSVSSTSDGSAPPTSSAAPSPAASASRPVDQLINTQSVISYQGIGAYTLGTPGARLQEQGLATPNQACDKMWDPTRAPQILGIELNFDGDGKLIGVSTMNPMMKTTSGAHAGMTFAQVAKIYGPRFSYVTLPAGEQGKLTVGRISQGNREILFGHRADSGQDSNASADLDVSWVMVQQQSKGIFWGC